MTRASKRKTSDPVATSKAHEDNSSTVVGELGRVRGKRGAWTLTDDVIDDARVAVKKEDVKPVGKVPAKQATGSLAATSSKGPVDPFAFDGGEEDAGSFGLIVKWVNKGQITSEWTFTMPNGSTVDSLRRMVDETTDGVLKSHAIILKHKNKTMDRSNATLSEYGVGEGAEVVLLLNHEAGQVPAAPTMVTEFPGEPVAKKTKKDNKKDGGAEKKRERFTKEEAEDLIKGVELYGLGQWAQIKASYFNERGSTRTGVDLKDKWRNLVTASQRPPGFKFRVEYLNDPTFLSRVTKVNDDATNKARTAV